MSSRAPGGWPWPAALPEVLSRRRFLGWLGALGLGGALPACRQRPPEEILGGPTEPTTLQPGGVVSGRVFGLLTGRPASHAVLHFAGVGTVVADFAGNFSVRVAASGDYRLRIRADGFVVRRTGVRVNGNAVVAITLIEADEGLTLEFFNEYGRGLGPNADALPRTPGATNRWQQPPRVLIYRRLEDRPRTVVSDERIDQIRAVVANAYAAFTAGQLGPAPRVEIVDGPPPAIRSLIPIGSIGVFQTASEGRGAGHFGSIRNPWAIATAHFFSDVDASTEVLTHLLGHALGAWDVDASTASVMNPDGRSTLTAEDVAAAQVLYGRPPGNRSPDVDPEDFVLNG